MEKSKTWERISNMGNTLNSIDERTKTLSDELIGKKAEKEVKNRQTTIVVTALITLLVTVLATIIAPVVTDWLRHIL